MNVIYLKENLREFTHFKIAGHLKFSSTVARSDPAEVNCLANTIQTTQNHRFF
jgi:hypothetical protein